MTTTRRAFRGFDDRPTPVRGHPVSMWSTSAGTMTAPWTIIECSFAGARLTGAVLRGVQGHAKWLLA